MIQYNWWYNMTREELNKVKQAEILNEEKR